jgi:ABC-type multidrug transport system ATPase subunit
MIDYNGKQEIYKIIEKLKKKNVGIIMTTNIIDELLYADKIVIINNNHEIKGIYKKKDIFNNLDLLKDFYIPLKFKLINKIGFNKIKDFSDKELLKYVNK